MANTNPLDICYYLTFVKWNKLISDDASYQTEGSSINWFYNGSEDSVKDDGLKGAAQRTAGNTSIIADIPMTSQLQSLSELL